MTHFIRPVLIIAFVATCLSLVLAEVFVRAVLSAPQPAERFLAWSSLPLSRHSDGAITFAPSQLLREAAVYRGSVEYDMTYPINDMGLVDDESYAALPPEVIRRVAIVGDSFTAGTGGRPWVPSLRRTLRAASPQLYLFNLGLIGASLEHSLLNLKHFEKKLHFDEIVLTVISDDFHRLYWFPLQEGSTIRFCPKDESLAVCRNRVPIGSVVDSNSREEDVTRDAAAFLKAQEQVVTEQGCGGGAVFGAIASSSRVLSMACSYYRSRPLVAAGELRQEIGGTLKRYVEQKNFEMLSEVRAAFPKRRITLIHLPEREEVQEGAYRLELASQSAKLGIEYFPALQRCRWTPAMFHQRDPHPNPLGYQAIEQCVRAALK